MGLYSVLLAAVWIAGNSPDVPASPYDDAPAPVVRTRFEVREKPTRATLRFAAPGLRDVTLNGRRLTETALPLWTSYDYRIYEDEEDVTADVRAGANELRFDLGNGWWNLLPMRMWGRFNFRETLPQGEPCVRATLELAFADGSRQTVGTDGSWEAGEGDVLRNSIYLGEKRDLRRRTAFGRRAREVAGPKGRILPRGKAPRTVIYRRWKAKSVTRVGEASVVDLGENFAGNVRVVLRGTRDGQVVSFKYGELLHPDGLVNGLTTVAGQMKDASVDPPGIAYQRDEVILPTTDEIAYEPRMTFHGFRYVEVRGLAVPLRTDDVEALAYSADIREAAGFEVADAKLAALREMCRRTFRSNLQEGVQSDCPARERMGYGGDLSCVAESFVLNWDMHDFYVKILRDRMDSARQYGGMIPLMSPTVLSGDSVMTGFQIDVPVLLDLMVRYYGDLDILREAYPTLKAHLAWMERRNGPDNVPPPCIGDHEAIEKGDPTTAAICHYHRFYRLTAKFARILGAADDAAAYDARAVALETVFRNRERYVPAKGYVGNGRQGEEVFAVFHRMFPKEDEDCAYQLLRKAVIGHGNALSTGIFATSYLLDVLTERGDAELAGKVVTHEGFPGWYHMMDRGATTLWETWAETDDIYSMNHPMLGSVAAWLMKTVVGIRVCEDAVGCDRVRIEPQAVCGLDHASGWYDTPHGRIAVSWRLEDGKMKVEKSVPQGVEVVLK